ncbi:MAG TPA: type II toxin-antitoxin system VapC family toxin [Thermoanaerobaculia bacterium]|nr:type II toxin-antitoxin system VapC family toxin [Thermoanaerobaculia bacterium]
MSVLLDTHLWIWWVTGQDRLTRRERISLGEVSADGALHISAISLWEAQMLHARGRLELSHAFEPWILAASSPEIVEVIPLDVSVILALDRLPASFAGDPADRIIVATARSREMDLATKDDRIRKSRLIRLWSP